MNNCIFIIALFFFFSAPQKVFSQAADSTIAPDSIRVIDSAKVLKSVIGKIVQDTRKYTGNPHGNIIIIDNVPTRNPVDISDYEWYPNIIYSGLIIDASAAHIDKGAFGINLGYKRYFRITDHWGLNGVFLFSYFYNGSKSYYYSGLVSEDISSKRKVENNFSFNIFAAPSYVFYGNGMIYGGIGLNFLNAKEFAISELTGPYLVDKPDGRLLFSQVIGFEVPMINNRLIINIEYNRTDVNNYFICRAGFRFK